MKPFSINPKCAEIKRAKSSMRRPHIGILVGGSALVELCVSPGRLHAAFVDGIEMVSQNYYISGQWSENIRPDEGPPTNYTGGYYLSTSDGTPVIASTADSFGRLGANSSVGSFSLYDWARCGMTSGNFSGRVQTQAQGLWDFSPEGGSINLDLSINAEYSFYGVGYGGLSVTLTDMTDSSTLLNVVNPVFPNSQPAFYVGQTTYTFVVDPSHVYEFGISGYSNTYDSDVTSLQISALITTVPEPSTLELLTFGSIGIAVLHRRHLR